MTYGPGFIRVYAAILQCADKFILIQKARKSHDYLQQINKHKKGSDFRVIFAMFGQQNSLILLQAEAPS